MSTATWPAPTPRLRRRGAGPFWLGRRLPPRDPNRCPRCGWTERRGVSIHNGTSIREDCAACGAFIKFVRWHGKAIDYNSAGPAGNINAQGESSCRRPGDTDATGEGGHGQPGDDPHQLGAQAAGDSADSDSSGEGPGADPNDSPGDGARATAVHHRS